LRAVALEKRTLGRTGLSVTKLCFGSLSMKLDGTALERGAELIAHAVGRGVRFMDCAEIYHTHPHVGEGLKRAGAGDVVVASKSNARTREEMERAFEAARGELGLACVDLFSLHGVRDREDWRARSGAWDCLGELKRDGLIRARGVTTHSQRFVRTASSIPEIQAIMAMINVEGHGVNDGTREEMEGALRGAHEAGKGTIAMKPLAGGLFYKRVKEAFDYVLSLDFLDSVAVGMITPEEVDLNLAHFGATELTEELVLRVKARKKRMNVRPWCKGCGDCEEACQNDAINVTDGKAVIAEEKCVVCGYCGLDCPSSALKVI